MAIFEQMPVLLAVLGIVLLIVEFAVLGFSTLFLVFISMACFATALLQVLGLLPETLLWSTASIAGFTVVFGVLLWKPMRRLQNRQQSEHDQPNTINGLQFRLQGDLGPTTHTVHQYSGIEWSVELDESVDHELPAGTAVVVTRTTVGKMFVRPV